MSVTSETKETTLLQELTFLLNGGNAHQPIDEIVKDLSASNRGTIVQDLPYTIWQLVEHIRITQWDILEFSRDPNHKSPEWPKEYWPKEKNTSDEEWTNCILQIKKDRQAFIQLLNDNKNNLYKPFPYGNGQTLLREALLIADHTSHHLGQIIVIRRLLNDWE